jgi:hypothetical protein
MPVEWLLKSKDPSIAYLTLRDVLAKSGDSENVKKGKDGITRGEKFRRRVSGQESNGGLLSIPIESGQVPTGDWSP